MNNRKLTAAERFAKMGERLEKDGRLQVDVAKLELSEQIFQIMQDKDISETELSCRLSKSQAYINKILEGSIDFTIESLIQIGIALGCELKLEFVELERKDTFLV